ncbi:sigma 54-interacting transcriptional regulator [Ichthyobacterium seriolicida]|uniref:ATPase AAA n=1 Tax=Ichthyobacterium seriolicida TaxID=242600 RepID=A0A1J1DW28_9FLAO|nr:sigma-54 dependent transcriptional regulator [Ichthyobacterium seriolicida]BAV94066.1 ATPase AAA [Ichthyobacterium seriolicida]
MLSIKEVKKRFGIIGNSISLDRAIDRAIRVASSDISVLVTGESGVGKESIPKLIHHLSNRKHSNYIAVNCGAIPEGTIDSELFGHEKGSFTGAIGSRKGYFEEANRGTIFLDEVGELPLTTQARLLRVLENGEFIKVGSSNPMKTDVRIIAATNVNMKEAIKKNRFREDLYYRLNTVNISIPSLRERREDIYLLFKKFALEFSDKYKIPTIRLLEDAVSKLENYPWYGNIRQLKNFVEELSVMEQNRMVSEEVLSNYLKDSISKDLTVIHNPDKKDSLEDKEVFYKVLFNMKNEIENIKKIVLQLIKNIKSGQKIEDIEQIEKMILNLYSSINDQSNDNKKDLLEIKSLPTSYESIDIENIDAFDEDTYEDTDENIKPLSLQTKEKHMIKTSLKKHRGKRKKAALELGISERTLYRKIKQYDL